MSKLKSNIMYQSIYQVLAVCIPLITSPYLSRVIGAKGLGIYSYNYSIVSYFMLFAILGVSTYGMRAIAQSRGKEEISKTFLSIFSFQIFSSLVSLVAYIAFILIFVKDRVGLTVSFIHVFYLLGEIVNINWLFFGLEKYKTTVIRNIIVKFVTVLSIFLFVREEKDVINYIFILAFCNFMSNAVLWFKVKECITKVKISYKDITKHIKPNILLFLPALAASVYHIMDKTMLGMFSNAENSGYYYNADKLLNIPLTVVVACSNVFMSRISSLVKDGEYEQIDKTQNESIFLGMCLMSAVAFGVCAVAKEFVPWFFGKGFEPCIELIKYFAIIILVKTISTHTRSAFLIPEENDKTYAKAIIYGAMVNLVANYILIAVYKLGALGATLGTLIAETVVVFTQIIFMKERTSRKKCIIGIVRSFVYILMGFVMLIIVTNINLENVSQFVAIVVKICIGATIYLAECILVWKLRKELMPDMIAETIASIKRKLIKN